MRILIVCQNYNPEQFRINDISEQLVANGHNVKVLTGLPNYPTGKIPKEYRFGKKRNEIINGVHVIRSLEIGRRKGILGLGINYISYMLSASFKVLFMKNEFDIIYIYQLSPITMALPGIIMKKRFKVPVYLYCCDIWPESMKNLIPNENNIIFKIAKIFSKYIYTKCDEITVTSKPFIKYFNKVHAIPLEKISYIPQHAEDFYLKMDYKKDDKTVDFVFMGNIGIVQDVECILEAVETIKDIPDFKVHLVGDGTYLERCKEISSEKGLENIVTFHGRHPLSKMSDFYKLADACLITLKDENLIGLTMPSKLQGYMAAGKTIIGAINGAAQDVIKESNCGICVNASDYKALGAAMKDFINNPSKYDDCGKNGRDYFIKHFTKEIYIESIEKIFFKLLEEKHV